MVMPSFYKKPRASLGTRVEAAFKKTSIGQVYEQRRAAKNAPLTPMTPGLSFNSPTMQVMHKKGGWSTVTYRDPAAMNVVTFKVRSNTIKEKLKIPRTKWTSPEGAVYSQWIRNTEVGGLDAKRRQVEGMLKVAIIKKDVELEQKLRQILQMPDRDVAKFWDAWRAAHTDVEIDEFFDYEDYLDEAWL